MHVHTYSRALTRLSYAFAEKPCYYRPLWKTEEDGQEVISQDQKDEQARQASCQTSQARCQTGQARCQTGQASQGSQGATEEISQGATEEISVVEIVQ